MQDFSLNQYTTWDVQKWLVEMMEVGNKKNIS